jgi:UDP-N-acetylglucosamine--N-acetylmuramyl-(pentapeptide) pyrophosphoryl-undecaprenol N-acetylglucosamine transferase
VKTLLVASEGGHVTELHRLFARLSPVDGDATWVTNDCVQTRSLLDGEDMVFVPVQASRDLPLIVANGARASRLVRRLSPDRIVSTGAGIALSVLLPGRAFGIDCHYIESAARVSGPSSSGRVLHAVPGVKLYTQHPSWADARWRYEGSVFDGFTIHEVGSRPVRRVVVTLGTWTQPFRRLLEHLVPLVSEGAQILCQSGPTDVEGLRVTARPWMPAGELHAALREADVVVTHAGVGAIIDALEAGKLPIVVPRSAEHGEFIDNHQMQLAARLEQLGLAIVRCPGELRMQDLELAASHEVGGTGAGDLPPFRLR